MHHQAVFIKRHALVSRGLYDTQYKILADHKMQTELYLHGYKFKHIRKFINIYDTTGLSSTQSALKEEEERALILRHYFSEDEIEQAKERGRLMYARLFVKNFIAEAREKHKRQS